MAILSVSPLAVYIPLAVFLFALWAISMKLLLRRLRAAKPDEYTFPAARSWLPKDDFNGNSRRPWERFFLATVECWQLCSVCFSPGLGWEKESATSALARAFGWLPAVVTLPVWPFGMFASDSFAPWEFHVCLSFLSFFLSVCPQLTLLLRSGVPSSSSRPPSSCWLSPPAQPATWRRPR